MIKNYKEVIVNEAISDLIKSGEKDFFACTCEDCMSNIKAIVLNELKPYYVTCKAGEVFGNYQSREVQNQVDVLAEIVRAKEIVSKNPHHGQKQKSLD